MTPFRTPSGFDAMSIADSTATGGGSSTPFTDGSSTAEPDDIAASWNLAIRRCRELLEDFDFSRLQQFKTPEKLAEDFQKIEAERPAFQVPRSPIKRIKSFFTFFIVTMAPRTLEQSIFWGLFYLLIELAVDSQAEEDRRYRWEKTTDMLETVTRSLDICQRAHKNTPFDEDMKVALNDAFIALITLWAEAVHTMKEHPYDHAKEIQEKFNKTIQKVADSFTHLKNCADTRDTHAATAEQQTPGEGPKVPLRSLIPDTLTMPCGDAPFYNDSSFYGRQDVLENIHLTLSPGSRKDQKFVTICGLGGVGKSKVAMAYAKRYGDHFDVTLWIKSQTKLSISQSFTDIAVELAIPGADKNGKGDDNVQLIFQYLKKHGKSWLMIWDNVETLDFIRAYLSTTVTAASMLVTTRYPEEAIYSQSRGPVIDLKPFSPAESKSLFAQLLGPRYHTNDADELKAHEILMTKMGGLAIGICTMASRIRTKKLSVRSFLNLYRKGRLPARPGELEDYTLTVETIWNDSFDTILTEELKTGVEGFKMLGILSFCSPDKTPRELIFNPDLDPVSDAPQSCGDLDDYLEAMSFLNERGLISADQDFKVIAIHRLVQDAFRKYLMKLPDSGEERCQSFFELTVRLVHQVFPKQIEGRPLHLQWDDCRNFIQHGIWLADVFEDSLSTSKPLKAPEELGELLKSCIWYLVEVGEYSECLRVSEIALKGIEKETFSHAHLETSLASTYSFQNNLGRARPHLEAGLRIMRKFRDETSEEYIGIVGNMGNLLAAEGNSEAALEHFLKVERTRADYNHPQNLGLAFIHLGIGRVEFEKRNYEAAGNRFNSAMKIVQKEHGERGQYMSDVYYAFGNLDLKRSQFRAAANYYSKALELQEEQNNTVCFFAAILYKKACALMALNDFQLARDLLDRALKIAVRTDSEGEEARILQTTANLILRIGQEDEVSGAMELRTRAKELKSQVQEKLGLSIETGSISESEQYDRLVYIVYR